MTIIVNPAPSAKWSLISAKDKDIRVHSNDSSLSVTSYKWNFGDGGTGTGYTVKHSYTADGSYNIKLSVTDGKGCMNTFDSTITVTTTIPIGISTPVERTFDMSVYPNPFSDKLQIHFELMKSSPVRISMSDILGKEIQVISNKEYNAGKHELDFNSKLPSGVYYLRMNVNGNTRVEKIIKMD